jgi:glycosyltransferase involved in cell wall biosynthesis
MLTVCIPVYNADVRSLINQLARQSEGLPFPVELLLIDDNSKEEFKALNREISGLARTEYLSENIGRAAIRNRFPSLTKSPWLLFLDDGIDIPEHFLSKYISFIEADVPLVVCGGKVVGSKPGFSSFLRYQYARKRENLPSVSRSLAPYHSFITGNFLIHRSVFNQVQFEESLVGYGHEDTLFGFELKMAQIPVVHIDNAIVIKHFDSTSKYLKKSEEGILNLLRVLRLADNHPDLVQDIRLLRVYQQLPCSVSGGCFRGIARPIYSITKFLLLMGIPSLRLFDLFKLSYLVRVHQSFLKAEVGD